MTPRSRHWASQVRWGGGWSAAVDVNNSLGWDPDTSWLAATAGGAAAAAALPGNTLTISRSSFFEAFITHRRLATKLCVCVSLSNSFAPPFTCWSSLNPLSTPAVVLLRLHAVLLPHLLFFFASDLLHLHLLYFSPSINILLWSRCHPCVCFWTQSLFEEWVCPVFSFLILFLFFYLLGGNYFFRLLLLDVRDLCRPPRLLQLSSWVTSSICRNAQQQMREKKTNTRSSPIFWPHLRIRKPR